MEFHKIIGNEGIKTTLTKSVQTGNISHSYMFVGIEGIGKRLFAQEFARMLLCMAEEKPCEKCKSCIEFNSCNHPDYYEIDTDENTIKIEQIRLMQNKILEKPIISNKKVYVINQAEKMTREAQNCLLKTLEEPPEYVCIILIVSNENAMLNTIKSRCTKILFHPIENEELKEFLEKKYDMNSLTSAFIKACEGSIKKALRMKENQEIYQELNKIFYNIETISLIDVLGKIDALYKNKEIIYELLEYLNTIFFEKSKEDVKYINYIKIVEEVKRNLKANANYDMCIDYLLLSIFS